MVDKKFKNSLDSLRKGMVIYIILTAGLIFSVNIKGNPASIKENRHFEIEKTSAMKDWHIEGAFTALKDKIPEVQIVTLNTLREFSALNKISKSQLKHIVSFLQHSNDNVRIAALNALGEMGGKAKEYISHIAANLKAPNNDVKAAALKALGKMGKSAKDYIPQIAGFLNQRSARFSVIKSFESFIESPSDNTPQIGALLKENRLLFAAVEALDSMDDLSKEYIPQIAAVLNENKVYVAVSEAFEKLRVLPWNYRQKLNELFEQEKSFYYDIFFTTPSLWIHYNLSKDKIQEIAAYIDGKNSKEAAAQLLIKLGAFKGYIPQIIAFYDDLEREISLAIKDLINSERTSNDYTQQIKLILNHENLNVRLTALQALSNKKDMARKFIPEIEFLLKKEDSKVPRTLSQGSNDKEYLFDPFLLSKGNAHLNNANLELTALKIMNDLEEFPEEYLSRINKHLADKDSNVRRSALKVLRDMKNLAHKFIPRIRLCLNDESLDVKISALELLLMLEESVDEHIMIFITSIKDSDFESWPIYSEFWYFQKKSPPQYILRIAELLKNKSLRIRFLALQALIKLNALSKDQISKIEALLKSNDIAIANTALQALINLDSLSKNHLPKILALLNSENLNYVITARNALLKLDKFSNNYIPPLKVLLKNKDIHIADAALQSLIILDRLTIDLVPQIEFLLKSEYINIKKTAIKALMKLDKVSNVHLPHIEVLLNSQDNKDFALKALIKLNIISPKYFSQVIEGLESRSLPSEDSYVEKYLQKIKNLKKEDRDKIYFQLVETYMKKSFDRYDIFEKLVKMGKIPKQFIIKSLELIDSGDNFFDYDRKKMLKFLFTQKEFDLEIIFHILKLIYRKPSLSAYCRFLSYLMCADKKEVEILLKWIGKPGENSPDSISHDDAKETLETFDKVWELAKNFTEIHSDLIEQTSIIAHKKNVKWQKGALEILEKHLKNLKSIDSTHADALEKTIVSIKRWKWELFISKVWLLHAFFWMILIFVYPRSSLVQTIFFWNPYIRKIMGLGYVNFCLTWIPYLRKKLFEPFRESLLADAVLDQFNEESYFKDSLIFNKNSKEILPIKKAIPKIKGQVILEGESGLGKTIFLRQLLLQTKKITIYLPAQKCSNGVMGAIQEKLHGAAKDTNFLKKLVFSGSLDICIDGVNEVNVDSRARITQFTESFFNGNIIITTQPMEWSPPSTSQIYVLLPLEQNQIEKFLVSRKEIFKDSKSLSVEEYENICKEYLETTFDEKQPIEILNSKKGVLSNPMDLEIIARMLVQGESPNLFSLQEQQYKVMAKDYQRLNVGREFPLKNFSERIFHLRLQDEFQLPKNEFFTEIKCMARHKMVLCHRSIDIDKNPIEKWYFRHDKIMDFFIVQNFTGDSEYPAKYIDDTRFRGVYFQLANLMPFDAAMALREKLIQYSADTRDHYLSDTFVKLLSFRKSIKKS